VESMLLMWMSYKKQELFTLGESLDSPGGLVESMLLIVLVFCVVSSFYCFVCFRSVFCELYVANVSGLSILTCPFGFL
jgi:hypothetical protein